MGGHHTVSCSLGCFETFLSTGSNMGDCFAVLMKTHMLYFASFVAGSCFHLGNFAPKRNCSLWEIRFILAFLGLVQLFALGPRLILSVRELNVQHLDDYDEGGMSSTIEFQMHVGMSTGDDV
ncbi:uncharacterized protein HD556DRAFT_19901 [Suillus plorans]|uniref:Uncharacterized protein n=1 Tax=Suillus plorans TaxID=116603 RepID=A0A9P7J9L1_9AGAM|nr:uncharacterized protein HD556DRAFT_19901 [Suillus plorans]KAG1810003.1 hypothetical protein HD556DRAFT_19901 [Suillus plorans]